MAVFCIVNDNRKQQIWQYPHLFLTHVISVAQTLSTHTFSVNVQLV